MGKMYYGLVPLEFGTPTGGGEPADPNAPVAPDVDGSYTIPGTLIGDFTTTGTFTPPAGVTLVHVAVVGGGGSGGGYYYNYGAGGGGAGGQVSVYRDVPVSGSVAVTIGGTDTASAFGELTAAAGQRGGVGNETVAGDGWLHGVGGGGWGATSHYDARNGGPGQNGPTVNGTHYGGGGGGGTADGKSKPGGNGGGGPGCPRPDGSRGQQNGTDGTGGGGGGGNGAGTTWTIAGTGGSGRVMVFTEQTTREAFAAPIEPAIHAALDGGVMVGAYAIDPVAPVDTLGVLVPYPLEPQPTGEVWTDEETGETHPVLAWPVKGWTYNNGDWSP